MRRLLIASYHFPPSGASASFRLLGFANHLRSYGWTCDVVSVPVTPWEARDESLAKRIPPETTVYEVPFPYGKISRYAVAILGFSAWLPRAWRKTRSLLKTGRYDAILTSGPPHVVHQLGVHGKKLGVPWVADFRDPWAGAGKLDWVPQPIQWGDAVITKRDPKTIAQADAVIANAPKIAELFKQSFPAIADRISYVTNGYDPEDFETPEAASAKPPGPDEPVTLVHTGGIYAGRDPIPVVEAVGAINASNALGRKLLLKFVGSFDPNVIDLNAEIAKRGLEDCVKTVGRVPYGEVIKEMRSASILLLLDTPGRHYGLPAKLYEYVGASRPVLSLGEKDSDMEWALKESAVPFRVAGYRNPEEIRDAIIDLAKRGDEPIQPSGVFARSRLAGRLAERLDAVVDAAAARKRK